MKDMPTRGEVVGMSTEVIARLRCILNKDTNVVFVDFSKGK